MKSVTSVEPHCWTWAHHLSHCLCQWLWAGTTTQDFLSHCRFTHLQKACRLRRWLQQTLALGFNEMPRLSEHENDVAVIPESPSYFQPCSLSFLEQQWHFWHLLCGCHNIFFLTFCQKHLGLEAPHYLPWTSLLQIHQMSNPNVTLEAQPTRSCLSASCIFLFGKGLTLGNLWSVFHMVANPFPYLLKCFIHSTSVII